MSSDDLITAGGSAQRWRSDLPGKKGMTREVRIVAYGFIVAVILGGLFGVVAWLFTSKVETLFICVPVLDYDFKELPAVPLGKADAVQLREQLKTTFTFSDNFDLEKYKTRNTMLSYFNSEFDPASQGTDEEKKARKDRDPNNKNTFSKDVPLVVYISALGRQADNQPYLLPTDYAQDKPDTWISLKLIIETIQKHPAKSKVLLLDLSYPTAGIYEEPLKNDVSASIDALLDQMNKDKTLKMPVLTSCSPGETSQLVWVHRQSLFGYYLEHGLNQEAKPANKLTITVRELADYVSSRVENWARKCLQAPQHPKLYWPADYKDFELRKFRPGDQGDTPPAVPVSTAAETPEAKKQAELEKEKQVSAKVREQFFSDDLRKAWDAHDSYGQSADWVLAYPALRQWERQLLSAERCFQAGVKAEPYPQVPAFERRWLKVIFGLHHVQPAFDNKEWKEQLAKIKEYRPKKQDALNEQPWFEQASHAEKAQIIQQTLWNNLTSTGTLSPETVKTYYDMLKAIEQLEKKTGNTDSRTRLPSVELFLLQAINRQITEHGYDQELNKHGDNIKKMLRLIAQLEGEVGLILQDPIDLPTCQEGIRQAEGALYRAIEAQFVKDYRYEPSAPIAGLLRQAEVALIGASLQRKALQQNRQQYWESIKTLHASSEWVVYDSNLYDAWVRAADAGAKLGSALSTPARLEGQPATATAAIDLKELTQPYLPDELKKRSLLKQPTERLIHELNCSLLPAAAREETLRMILRQLEEEHRQVRLMDPKGKPPAQTEILSRESEWAERRKTIAKHLRALAGLPDTEKLADLKQKHQDLMEKKLWFNAARLECLLPVGQVPDVNRLALVVERHHATILLADWLRERLQNQQKLLANFKIDSDFNPLYTRATSACGQLKTDCQNLLK